MGRRIHSSTKRWTCCSRRFARDPATDLLVARVLFGFLVGILVRRDVVDAEVVLFGIERAPVLVGVVEARDRPLLDRAARLVAILLRLALVLRRRVGAEVLAARCRYVGG